jgi:hypothetical protein
LATLRRDGFASMDHPALGSVRRIQSSTAPGTLTTRPVRFTGRHLFVNVNASGGTLRVEVLDRDGRVITPYGTAQCVPIAEDSTRVRVAWGADLASLAGEPVRFRFHLSAAQLYAFWVSDSPSGSSHGYVAAGGPEFSGITDGAAVLER